MRLIIGVIAEEPTAEEPIVDSGAYNIALERDILRDESVCGSRIEDLLRESSQIVMQVFNLGRPVRRERLSQPSAHGRTALVVGRRGPCRRSRSTRDL